jgi:multidrug efflux pump
LPQGVTWDVPYDTTPFITASITDVVQTLVEAIALVFVVMLIFLQNIRATIIPTLVIPVALLGTFIGLSLLHFTLNQLTLFGMVLAIGIVVDDAIVVIENVERIMDEEHLEPEGGHAQGDGPDHRGDHRDHRGAGRRCSSLGPAAGRHRDHLSQFALTIAVSMGISALLALSFTPSLCAAILKPVHEERRRTGSSAGSTGPSTGSATPTWDMSAARAPCAALDDRLRTGGGAGRLSVYAAAHQLRPR